MVGSFAIEFSSRAKRNKKKASYLELKCSKRHMRSKLDFFSLKVIIGHPNRVDC